MKLLKGKRLRSVLLAGDSAGFVPVYFLAVQASIGLGGWIKALGM